MNNIKFIENHLLEAVDLCRSKIEMYNNELYNLRYWLPLSTDIEHHLVERETVETQIKNKISYELKDLEDSFRNNRKLGFLPSDMLKRVESYAEKLLNIKLNEYSRL